MIKCKKVIVERALSNCDIVSVSNILAIKNINITFSIHYNDLVKKNVLNSILKNNIKDIWYDICILHEYELKNEATEVLLMHGIERKALKNVKLSCGAGINKFYIDKHGDIYPCYRLRKGDRLANIYNDSSDTFLNSIKPVKIPENCQKCDVEYFCAGGCKAEYKDSQYKYCKLAFKDIMDNI